MEQKTWELLMQRLDKMDNSIISLAAKIDDLYKWRWQIVGGSVLLSILFGVFVKLI